jgi:hypothetical protein
MQECVVVITLKPVPTMKAAAAIQPSGVIIDTAPSPTSAKLMAWSDWRRKRQ